jgi:hypothetical protein
MSEKNDNLDFTPSVPYYLAMGASYLGGLTIYAFKMPERWRPGKFDIVVSYLSILSLFTLSLRDIVIKSGTFVYCWESYLHTLDLLIIITLASKFPVSDVNCNPN